MLVGDLRAGSRSSGRLTTLSTVSFGGGNASPPWSQMATTRLLPVRSSMKSRMSEVDAADIDDADQNALAKCFFVCDFVPVLVPFLLDEPFALWRNRATSGNDEIRRLQRLGQLNLERNGPFPVQLCQLRQLHRSDTDPAGAALDDGRPLRRLVVEQGKDVDFDVVGKRPLLRAAFWLGLGRRQRPCLDCRLDLARIAAPSRAGTALSSMRTAPLSFALVSLTNRSPLATQRSRLPSLVNWSNALPIDTPPCGLEQKQPKV